MTKKTLYLSLFLFLPFAFSCKENNQNIKPIESYLTIYENNKKAGEKFLEENAKRDEVKVLESGLQYEVLNEGNGEIPKETDKVRVHYRGTFIDGKVFDSSIDRGEPMEFFVNKLIWGWVEALQLMPVGSKWILYIPHFLAYGAKGNPPILPYSTIIFELELLSIIN